MPDSAHAPNEAIVRRTLLFSGRVQGVGFRFTTCEVARRFEVVGHVKNLPDGRVEMVAEGSRQQVGQFEEAVKIALDSYISDSTATESAPLGDFTSFSVAY